MPKITSQTGVMQALAKFVIDADFEFELATLPDEIEEINTLFLDTAYADNIETRRKMLHCKKFILDFCHFVDPTFLEEIKNLPKEKEATHA